MLFYYFFERSALRLMRAWKRSLGAFNLDHAGHRLSGEGIHIYPANHTLRHYIGLSEAHLRQKYLTRKFAPEAIAAGWHDNRIIINESNLVVPEEHDLFALPSPQSKAFNKSIPRKTHFWEWQRR